MRRPAAQGDAAEGVLLSDGRVEVALRSVGAFGEGRCPRWGAGGPVEAFEDGLRGVRRVDRGEHAHPPATAWALEDIDREDAPQEERPG
jgi:hypothetical protein